MVKEGVVDLLSRVLLLNSDVQTQEMAMQVLMNISSDGIPLNIKYYIILLGLISLYLFKYRGLARGIDTKWCRVPIGGFDEGTLGGRIRTAICCSDTRQYVPQRYQ